jgi:ribose 5-phosphate isomerase B
MKIAVANDHAGINLKNAIRDYLTAEGHEVLDLGPDGNGAVDYPDYVFPLAEAVTSGKADLGIFACGSGLGPAIAANKVPGVRAVTCHDVFSARSSRRDNNANVLTMGERVIGTGAALEVVKAWVNEPFSGADRHQRRIDKITQAERTYCKRSDKCDR